MKSKKVNIRHKKDMHNTILTFVDYLRTTKWLFLDSVFRFRRLEKKDVVSHLKNISGKETYYDGKSA